MIGIFFYGIFAIVCLLFLAQLYLAIFYKPEDQSKRGKTSLMIFALSIMALALLVVGYSQALTPYTTTLVGNDGSSFTQTTPISDAPAASALLRFANVLTLLGFGFMVVNVLLGFNIFGHRRFNKNKKG